MNTSAAFLQAILEKPEDDNLRLVFADWLIDHDQEERADFIRSQISKGDLSYRLQYLVDKHSWELLVGRCMAVEALLARHKVDTSKYPSYSWGSNKSPTGEGLYKCGAEEVYVEYKDLLKLVLRRGFIERVVCTEKTWLDIGPRLVVCQPLVNVLLSDRKPSSLLSPWDKDELAIDIADDRAWVWAWADPTLMGGRVESSGYSDRYGLDSVIFAELVESSLHRRGDTVDSRWRIYRSKKAALDASSAACLLWARKESRR